MNCGKLIKTFNALLAFVLAFAIACPVVYANPAAADSEKALFYADVNRDESIDAKDALDVLKFVSRLITELPGKDSADITGYKVGDVNADGKINASDALDILKYAAKIIDSFIVEGVIIESETPEPTEDVTPEPTEDVTPEPTEDVTPEPTEDVTPAPTEDVTPEPTEDVTPEPTEDVTPEPSEDVGSLEPINLEIKEVNNAATVEDGVITFIDGGDETEGVEVVNPFIGQDEEIGGAISFWINSPVDNKTSDDYGYDSLISIVNKDLKQVIKFDIQGTRQYNNTFNSEKLAMNYWNAYLPLKAGEDAFITCVVCHDGLKYYCNGKEIGFINYSGADDALCRPLVKTLLTYEGTRIFVGGTAQVADVYVDICKHSLTKDIKVWDLKAYKCSMTADEVKALYDKIVEDNNIATPTPVPTINPDDAKAAIPVEVVNLNDVATVEGSTYTFGNPLGCEDGIEVTNPLAGVTNAEGGTLSFWFTPAVDYDGQSYKYTSLLTLVDPETNQLIKFDCEGTRQYQHFVNSKKLNYYATDAKLTAGTEYFVTVTIHADGMDYFINGNKLEIGEWFSKEDQGTAKKLALELLFAEDTRVFIGGTGNVPNKYLSIVQHSLAEGTKVRDFYGYKSVLSDEEIKELYEKSLAGEVIPTAAPSDEPVVTASPEPTESEAPDITGKIVEVKALNDAAVLDNDTYTFNAPASNGLGVSVTNPFAGKDLTNGATISYLITPGENTFSQYESVPVIVFSNEGVSTSPNYIKFDLAGTSQYQKGSTSVYNWWNCSYGNPKVNTEIFVTVVIGEDSTVKFYVNGTLYNANGTGTGSQDILGTTTVSEILSLLSSSDTDMYIGGYNTATSYYVKNKLPQGTKVRQVKTYNTALTLDEVKAIYEGQLVVE